MSAVAAPAPVSGRAGAVRTRVARGALVVVAAAQLEVGVWGELAPRSFWASFPGFGHHWV